MRTMLPATTDPARFEEWCRAFRIRADIVAVEHHAGVIGYEAITDHPDDELAIALKWTAKGNVA